MDSGPAPKRAHPGMTRMANGGHVPGRVRVRWLCPPYRHRTRHSYPTLPTRGKSADILPLIRGGPELRWKPVRSHHRRVKISSCRMKKARRSFACGSSQRNHMTLMFGGARFCEQALSASLGFGISHYTARHARRAASPHAAQVLQATMDFSACESARRVMRIKRLKRRAFSLSLARREPRTAFSLPQRA
jgi:hypothetical protein